VVPSRIRHRRRGSAIGRGVVAMASLGAIACERQILVGADRADAAQCPADSGSDAALPALVVPWSTGFENGLADWNNQGLCYGIIYPQIVTSPVHSGQHAAAFTVNSAVPGAFQARCKKTGVLPESAYYGAWYWVPNFATNNDNWNLLHFQGSNVANGSCVLELWDVSLKNDATGGLTTSVYDFMRSRSLPGRSMPTAQWVHLEVYIKRAADNTGQFTFYQDGQAVVDLTGLSTDDSAWGEWHVGNLATALSPPMSTVYVDDVTIDTRGP
jgi:hypothetical protein